MAEEYDGHWALLTDKGYQGAADVIRAVMPKKKPKAGSLSHDDQRVNRKFSADRIIVEMFLAGCRRYGQLCQTSGAGSRSNMKR